MQSEWQAARDRSPYFGGARPQLPAPLGGAPHLPGVMPGDYGFDPLGLWAAADEGRRRWYAEAELLHSRWAMLAVVGCLIPEVLDVFGVDVGEPVWWKVWPPACVHGATKSQLIWLQVCSVATGELCGYRWAPPSCRTA